MLSIGALRAGISSASEIFKRIGLFEAEGRGCENISEAFKIAGREKDYKTTFDLGRWNMEYDFCLTDTSFFQFSRGETDAGPTLRYAFYHNPHGYISYEEYIDTYATESLIGEHDREMAISTRIYQNEYEQFLDELSANHKCMSIRYDYSPGQHKPNLHPTSHLHLGNNDTMRLPSSISLNPQTFSLFIIRQLYVEVWKGNLAYLMSELQLHKNSCSTLPINLFHASERHELYFN